MLPRRFAGPSFIPIVLVAACARPSANPERSPALPASAQGDAAAEATPASPDAESSANPSPADARPVDAAALANVNQPTPDGASSAPRGIRVQGRRLWVDGREFVLRGVCWNPVGAGGRHPEALDFAGYAAQDIAGLSALGANVVRTYEPLLDLGVLDQLAAAGIYVINAVYTYGGAPPDVVVERIRAVKHHPAILGWSLGNEWNYNGLYVGLGAEDSRDRLNDAARLAKAEDPEHPVISVYGELPDIGTLEAMPDVDIWGINVYRGISFGDLFERWQALSDKPMFIAEYGADAYDSNLPGYAPQSQAEAVAALAEEIRAQSALGVALGGTLFEWADEWWKDESGSLDQQDAGGVAPGSGPYPDGVFNEEWWGIVDLQRTRRPAFERLREVFQRQP